ncbi:hypothetical protein J1605_015159 [Eschrichtius robustus]|uniref:Ankyrin repeat domain-containing protein 29 n=1 Tax=Eschrichtius robustus TaxID=9764 RepID=A0AB34GC78_ESCRO|nr:hypothetical protein J1605_015159 [Eschrichtius robustus]
MLPCHRMSTLHAWDARFLLAHKAIGAEIKKETPLANAAFWAARRGNLALLRLLLNSGRVDVDCKDSDGGTALLAASQYGHMKVVETLLKHGANIHDQLYDGATALFLAAQGGYLDVIRLLLSSGAKVNQPRQDGTAPLWIASQMGHSEVVRVMLLRGADRDAARHDGTTALLKAANKGYNDVIKELLKFSPTLGILKNGTSALHVAVLSGNIKAVALLLEAGADPALRNKIIKQAIATHSDKGCQQEVKNAIAGFLERVTFQLVQKHPSALGAPGLLRWGRCQRRRYPMAQYLSPPCSYPHGCGDPMFLIPPTEDSEHIFSQEQWGQRVV